MNQQQIRAILGSSELAWIVDRLRRRAEAGLPLTGTLRLSDPSEAQRNAVSRLLGRYPGGAWISVSLETLEQTVRKAGAAANLMEALEALVGPLQNRAAIAEQHRSAWELAFDQRHAGTEASTAWWEELASSGLVKRLVGDDPPAGATLLQAAAALSRSLPAAGVLLAELAATLTGDAHALDLGAPLGTLALRLLPRVTGVTDGDRRTAWAAAGVELDLLSSSVLALNLPATGDGVAARLLRTCGAEPCRLTLRQLRAGGLRVCVPTVFACENPSVLAAAADRLGERCAPLICVEGQPRAAVHALLCCLEAELRYHGDLDWGGLRIANTILARPGARAWRMSTADYDMAPKGGALTGRPVAARWDPELSPHMEIVGRAVHEEAVLDALLEDLAG